MVLNQENVSKFRENFFTSIILLATNNFEPNRKKVSGFGQNASFLNLGELLTPQLGTNNEFSIAFNPLENSS